MPFGRLPARTPPLRPAAELGHQLRAYRVPYHRGYHDDMINKVMPVSTELDRPKLLYPGADAGYIRAHFNGL